MAQLAKAVNHVLTQVYTLLYSDEDVDSKYDTPHLKLQTSPLASSEEVEKLFAVGIVDLKTALPAALHALGATSDEVEAAMERGMQREEKKCACEDETRALQKQDTELNLQERKLGLEKTKADIKKTEHDAQVVHSRPYHRSAHTHARTRTNTLLVRRRVPCPGTLQHCGASGRAECVFQWHVSKWRRVRKVRRVSGRGPSAHAYGPIVPAHDLRASASPTRRHWSRTPYSSTVSSMTRPGNQCGTTLSSTFTRFLM